ncbi:unnamed protein product, partial [Didymodactylos carnosus]
MNQIIIQNPENTLDIVQNPTDSKATLQMDVDTYLDDFSALTTSTETATPISTMLFKPFLNNSLDDPLLAYALVKFHCFSLNHSMPLLTGFFATHLPAISRQRHIISFCCPILDDPSSQACANTCLQMTKCAILDSKFQRETVLVADEKIYTNCNK